jgi:hypothetical protein
MPPRDNNLSTPLVNPSNLSLELEHTQTHQYNSYHQPGRRHPTEDRFSTEPMASQITDHTKTQRPANAESSSGSSSNGNASPASADSIAPQPKIAIHTPEADGLYFDSYESATETVDPIFRDRINVKAIDDDILEVEHNRRHYVKLLVDALKYDDYMEAEEFRTTMTGVKKPCTASDVQAWDE